MIQCCAPSFPKSLDKNPIISHIAGGLLAESGMKSKRYLLSAKIFYPVIRYCVNGIPTDGKMNRHPATLTCGKYPILACIQPVVFEVIQENYV